MSNPLSSQQPQDLDAPSGSSESAISSSFFDEPIDFGSHVNLEQDPLQGLLSSSDASSFGAVPAPAPHLTAARPTKASEVPTVSSPSAAVSVAMPSTVARDKTPNDSKPKKPRKKKDTSQNPVDSPAGAKSKKTARSTKDKAGPSGSKAAEKAAKARSSTGRSMSRLSSVGHDVGTPPLLQPANSRTTDGEEDQQPANRAAGEEEQNENDDDEGEVDDGVEELGKDHYSTQEAIYAAQQRSMGLLSMIMDDDQLDRHMASRRGALNKTSVRKLVNHALSQSVSQHVAMVVSGVAKIFVGEMVEKARAIQAARRETGPLRPTHLREAHRQYYMERERPGLYGSGTHTGFPGLGKRRRMF